MNIQLMNLIQANLLDFLEIGFWFLPDLGNIQDDRLELGRININFRQGAGDQVNQAFPTL